ncbi:MAG: hypothetical protein ACJ0FU_04210 [Gammaproteobacteria bacterium]
MKVTDNLKNDISNAPDWFFKSIESQVKKKKIAMAIMLSVIRHGEIRNIKTFYSLFMELEHICGGGIQ